MKNLEVAVLCSLPGFQGGLIFMEWIEVPVQYIRSLHSSSLTRSVYTLLIFLLPD